jgi:hypothetical protein
VVLRWSRTGEEEVQRRAAAVVKKVSGVRMSSYDAAVENDDQLCPIEIGSVSLFGRNRFLGGSRGSSRGESRGSSRGGSRVVPEVVRG